MSENFPLKGPSHPAETPVDRLREEYQHQKALFDVQPLIVQRFMEAQAQQIAEAYVDRSRSLHFTLPDRVVTQTGGQGNPVPVPAALRSQRIGNVRDQLTGRDVHLVLRQRLAELDQSADEAVGVSSGLTRFSLAIYMVFNLLPP